MNERTVPYLHLGTDKTTAALSNNKKNDDDDLIKHQCEQIRSRGLWFDRGRI